MAQLRATGPYIWVTWLPRLLSGEGSCEWAAWFKAQHEGSSWARTPSNFDQAGWLMDHTAPAERTAGGLGETGLLRPDRGPEQLHPPWEQRQPGREARPGRPAQGRGYRH